MNSPTRVQVRDAGTLLAVVPHLLGFHPADSLVVIAVGGPHHRVRLAFRYDLPDPPDRSLAAAIADHTVTLLHRQQLSTAVVIGYGPGTLVTPVADLLRDVLPPAGIGLQDVLRVQDGRYWSYLCAEPSCCPAEGRPVSPAHAAAAVLAQAGIPAAPSRAALAATIAPLQGPGADAMKAATARAERAAARQLTGQGPDALDAAGLAAVKDAITCYRGGGSLTDPGEFARLALALTSLRVRDDAWARMDPAHRDAHLRLWTDLTRRARPGYIPAPASLLAFTAWQAGDGALANLALDRALADDPGYSMAQLLRDALAAGLPPSAAVLPMTPEECAASYDARRRRPR